MSSPEDLAEWSLHCFCLGAQRTPHAAIRHGDRGRLLFETESWRDPDDLRRVGVVVSDEDVRDLLEFRLLESRDGKLRCTFPRLGPEMIGQVRDRMAPTARIHDIRQEFEAQGQPHAFYSVLFGHVMDGLLWMYLRSCIEIPDTDPAPEFPLWRGVFWAVYPSRKDAIGTNEITWGDAVMTLVWTKKTSSMLNAMRQDGWPQTFLRFLLDETDAPPPQAISAGLADASGNPAVPVFGRQRFACIAGLAEGLAERAADHIMEHMAALSVLEDLPVPQRNVILIHEFIWTQQTIFSTQKPQPWVDSPGSSPPSDERGSILVRIKR